MVAENPLALSYILQGDVYLIPGENLQLNALPQSLEQPGEQAIAETPATPPVLQALEPAEVYKEPATISIPTLAPPVMAPQAVTPTLASSFNYTGAYQNKFLIMVYYPGHADMEPAHLNALESTIKRKELSLNDVAIVNLANYAGTDLRTIGGFFKPERMLFLGKDAIPPGLKNPLPLNQITKLGNCNFLLTFSFGEMMGNKENTKAFWEQMKAL
jgi:hypothetical protein